MFQNAHIGRRFQRDDIEVKQTRNYLYDQRQDTGMIDDRWVNHTVYMICDILSPHIPDNILYDNADDPIETIDPIS